MSKCELVHKKAPHFGKLLLFKRESGIRRLLIYCADYRCGHWIAISGDAWPDDARLSDIEERFTCRECGKHGADVRPDFNWSRKQVSVMRRTTPV